MKIALVAAAMLAVVQISFSALSGAEIKSGMRSIVATHYAKIDAAGQ